MFAEQEETRKRFLEEGYVANTVGHPGAVVVLDDDELEDGTPFLVMELLDGESLEDRLKKRTVLAPPAVMFIADRVLDVLSIAHEKGIIHRVIKPANLFLSRDGGVKVLDFGLARVRERTLRGSLTRTGMVVGTASYMPPEQARAKRDLIDARTDIWSVGATMFKALTGRYVHEGDTVQDRLIAAMSQRARSISSVKPDLPAPVVEMVDRALQFQMADRHRDARTMQVALRHAYELVEKQPLPGTEPITIVDMPDEALVPPPPSISSFDLSVSVVFEADLKNDSIVVDIEDTAGKQERYEIRRKTGELAAVRPPGAPESDAEDTELSDISIVELEK
jgi:serine/threonine-protein kinase